MAHLVDFWVPRRKLGLEDIIFEVKDRDGGHTIGTLLVSKGAVEWRPGRSPYVFTARWERFAELMERNGRPQRKPVTARRSHATTAPRRAAKRTPAKRRRR